MGFFIGAAQLEISMPGSHSLKDKRHLLKPVVERFGKSKRIAIAETGDKDLWKSATVSIICISDTAAGADKIADSVIGMLESGGGVVVDKEYRWVFKPEE